MVVLGKKCYNSGKRVVFGQNMFYSGKTIVLWKTGCIRAKWFF